MGAAAPPPESKLPASSHPRTLGPISDVTVEDGGVEPGGQGADGDATVATWLCGVGAWFGDGGDRAARPEVRQALHAGAGGEEVSQHRGKHRSEPLSHHRLQRPHYRGAVTGASYGCLSLRWGEFVVVGWGVSGGSSPWLCGGSGSPFGIPRRRYRLGAGTGHRQGRRLFPQQLSEVLLPNVVRDTA